MRFRRKHVLSYGVGTLIWLDGAALERQANVMIGGRPCGLYQN